MSDTPFRLDGHVALVTGAAVGLGRGFAVGLAKAGADVVVTDLPGHSTAETASAVRAQGQRALELELDVRQVDQIAAVVERLLAEFGRLDILVSNAGLNHPAPGLEVTPDNWDDHYDVNVKGAFFVAQAAARPMIAQGRGRVIFVSSISGMVGIPGQPAYCSTKGAVINLVRTLAVEWAPHGVTVNSIAPCFVETALTHDRLQREEFRNWVVSSIPVGRLGLPEDMANAAVFLASDEAAMVTGVSLPVDGGWTAR